MPAHTPEEVHSVFLQAFNLADFHALAELYEPAAVLVTARGKTVGRDAIREAYRQILAAGGRMELTTASVLDAGDGVALLHAEWTFHRGDQQFRGFSTEVVRRQTDGTWLFVLDEPRTPGLSGA